MPSDFVHLHVNTHYSQQNSTVTCQDLVAMARQYDMPAIAITDHDTLLGVMNMYDVAIQAGINPVIGCEIEVHTATTMSQYNMVLLAKDLKGYHNLCQLLSHEHIKQEPISPALLALHSKNLIAFKVQNEILPSSSLIREMKSIFGPENFYLELAAYALKNEIKKSWELVELAHRMNVPLVATNNIHYLKREHAETHRIMRRVAEKDMGKFEHSDDFYFKSPNEMEKIFRDIPEAIRNTRMIADRCQVKFDFPQLFANNVVASTIEEKRKLRQLCLDGLEKRYGTSPDIEIIKRMEYELDVIGQANGVRHYLTIWDIIRFAGEKGIPLGPGRANSSGSLVAFLCHITDIDPLQHNLSFEDFIDPVNLRLPHFEIDICYARYDEVLEYITAKYGKDRVAKIALIGHIGPKAAIRDVTRAFHRSFDDTNHITDLIPCEKGMTLKKAKTEVLELGIKIEQTPWILDVFKHAEIVEGTIGTINTHVASMIIGSQPISQTMPVNRAQNGELFIEHTATECERLGLFKLNLLPFSPITFIQAVVELIQKNHSINIDWNNIALDDKPTFELINRRDTAEVFMLENNEWEKHEESLPVESIKDLMQLLDMTFPTYAIITYRTAYLKTHYREEFMSAQKSFYLNLFK